MQRKWIWLALFGMVSSVALTATDADAAWRRRAWRRNACNDCCHSVSYNNCCDAGAYNNQQYGQPGDMPQGGPLESPPAAPLQPDATPPAPSAQ